MISVHRTIKEYGHATIIVDSFYSEKTSGSRIWAVLGDEVHRLKNEIEAEPEYTTERSFTIDGNYHFKKEQDAKN